MITVYCDSCASELHQPGALLFSPPDVNGVVEKIDLCEVCYEVVLQSVGR